MKAIPIITFLIVWYANALMIVQGPQVGNNKQTVFTVGWQTDLPSDSRLEWGLSQNALTEAVNDTTQRTWHVLTAKNLEVETKYYYRVTSNGISSPVYYSKTEVRHDSPFEFGLLTDTHGGDDFSGYPGYIPDLWFNCGDVVGGGEDALQRLLSYKKKTDKVENYVPIYEVVGNHDDGMNHIWANTDSPVYGFILPDEKSKDNYFAGDPRGQFYSFDYGTVHFQVNTFLNDWYVNQSFEDKAKWMAEDFLQARRRGQTHNIALGHFWLTDAGGITEQKNIMVYRVFDTSNVELYFHGHSHTYYREKLRPAFPGRRNEITSISVNDPYGGPLKCRVDFRQITIRNAQYGSARYDSCKLRPDIPENLQAEISGQQVRLSWNRVNAGVSINGIGGYNIYRSIISFNNTRNTTQSQYSIIGSVSSPDSLVYIDSMPLLSQCGKHYVVCAYDANYGKREGNYSNEVFANMQGMPLCVPLRQLSLVFYADNAASLPADPSISLQEGLGNVPNLTVTPDSSWLDVTVSGIGAEQVIHHTANIAGLASGRTFITRVNVTADGYLATGYTVSVIIGTPQAQKITISSKTAGIFPMGIKKFSIVEAIDQYNNRMYPLPKVTWAVSGGGSIDSTGLFRSNGIAGVFTVRAVSASNPAVMDSAVIRVALSVGCAVTASSSVEWDVYTKGNLTDGTTDKIFLSDCEAMSGDEWVEVDLGGDKPFSRVVLYPVQGSYTPEGKIYGFPVDFTITAKTAAGVETTVVIKTDYANPDSGAPQTFDFTSVTARYVRLTVTKFGVLLDNECRLKLAEMEIIDMFNTGIERAMPSPLYFGLTSVPNPFAASTLVKFNVPQSKNKEKQKVYVRIYDLNGKLVRTLAQGMFAAGYHTAAFNGRDNGNGRTLSNGIYFCRMQAPGYSRTLKLLLVE